VRLQTEIRQAGGEVVHDASDREAFDTLARVERKILAKGIKKDGEDVTPRR